MSKYTEEGFLSTEISDLVKQCHADNKEWFELYESINRYCWGITNKLKFHTDNKQEYISFALFLRMISIFESVYILNERGMVSETKILLRTLFEALFSLCAIAKHKEVAEEFYQGHIYFKYKTLKKLIESNSEAIMTDGRDHNKRLGELKNEIGKRKLKPLSIEELSKKAELHSFYTSAYQIFSWTTHTNIMEIGQLLSGESDKEVKIISLNPCFEEVHRYFLVGIECVVIALRNINQLFQLKENDKIEKYAREYQQLYNNNNIK